MKSLTTIVLIAILVVIGVVAFKKQKQDEQVSLQQEQTTQQPSAATNNNEAALGVSGSLGLEVDSNRKEFTISAKNYSFTPSTIRVKKGDTIQLTLANTEGMHDLKIDEFKVATQKIPGGQKETVTFVADKTGSFEYYCSVGTHRQMGMRGTLIVE